MNIEYNSFNDFVGDILIPTKFFTDFNEYGNKVLIPGLFYRISITKESIRLCDVKGFICYDIPKEAIKAKLNSEADIVKILDGTVANILYQFISADPELLAFCRANRIGGDGIIRDNPEEKSRVNYRTQWKAFIVRVLRKKKDWRTLKNFRKHGLPF